MKKILGSLLAVLLLFIAASVGTHFLVDQNVIRQQVVQAIKQQSDLDLGMSKASFQLLPWPSFHAEDLTLSRSGCEPFARAHTAHADISFLPLFHREIALKDFAIEGGQASFSQRGDRHCSSWFPLVTETQDNETASSKDEKSKSSDHTPWHVSFGALEIRQTQLEWNSGSETSYPLQGKLFLDHLALRDVQGNSPRLDLDATQDGTPVSLKGRLGPLKDLFVPSSRPWVFSLGLSVGDKNRNNQVTFEGVIGDLSHGGKASLTLQGHSATLQDWKILFPQAILPDIRELEGTISFKTDSTTSDAPFHMWGYGLTPTALSLHMGSITLSSQKESVKLDDIKLTAEGATPVLHAEGVLEAAPAPWHFMVSLGTPEQIASVLAGDEEASLPIDMQIQEGKTAQNVAAKTNVQFQAQGQIGAKTSRLTVKGNGTLFQIPEMPFLPMAWNQLAAGKKLQDFSLQTTVTLGAIAAPKRMDSVSFEDMQVKSQALNGEGSIAFSRLTQSVPRFDAHLHFDHLDGNEFLNSAGANESSKVTKHHTGHSSSVLERLVSLSKEWDGLADVTFDQFKLGDLTYHDLVVYGLMGDGKLMIDPLTARVDDYPLKARFAFDQTAEVSHLYFTSESFLVPVSLLLKTLHQPEFLTGTIQLDGKLALQWRKDGEFLSSLEGPLGFSMTEGRIEKSFLAPLAGPAASLLKLGKSSLKLRCIAGKLNFHNGQAELGTMAMQARHYAVEGKGKIDLKQKTLDLLVLPHIDLADNSVSTPLQVTGAWDDPRLTPARDNQGYFQMSVGGSERDACADAVRDARGGHPGPALSAAETHSDKAKGILKALGIGGKL
ncbi:AsmA family protein [Acetobacteraceae bacterium ESL0709]|nr:AsmA family protein [Acetobacteraceae bacterium ESL0697]MDF7677578.1 AsmA family protein [Acetobacteraceae bacterium ESL0709]